MTAPLNLNVGDLWTDTAGNQWRIIDVIDGPAGIYAMQAYLPDIVVSNVAALATLSPRDGQKVTTLGYYTPGDGGYRELRYSASSTATVDGILAFAALGGIGRHLENDIRGFIWAKQAGAKGDDSTDDTARINAAVATGYDVCLNDTIFAISGPIVLSTFGQRLFAHGDGKLRMTVINKNCIEVTANNVKVEHVSAIGFGGTTATITDFTKNHFVYALNVYGLQVKQCFTTNFNASSVFVQQTRGTRIAFNFFSSTGTDTPDSSAEIIGWGGNKGLQIIGNFCCGDLDNGIFVGANAGDKHIIIADNVIFKLDAGGNLINPTQRRHNITIHYDDISSPEHNHVSVTGNICHGCLNSAIYFIGKGGAITITGNSVNTADTGTTDAPLGGGVAIHGTAEAIIISGNIISGVVSDVAGCITISKADGTSTTVASCIISANMLHDSDSFGIRISIKSQYVLVDANMIWKTMQDAIRIESDAAADPKGIQISNNLIYLEAQKRAVSVYTGGTSVNTVYVYHNQFFFAGTKGNIKDNAAVYSNDYNTWVVDNHLEGFKTGVYYNLGIVGRQTKPKIKGNKFRNLDFGIVGRGDNADGVMFADSDNVFESVTTKTDGDGYYDAVRFGKVHAAVGTVTIYGTALPANGTWVVGDEILFTNPAAGGNRGGVYTASGWKTFGAIAA